MTNGFGYVSEAGEASGTDHVALAKGVVAVGDEKGRGGGVEL